MDGNFNRATWQGGPALLNQRVCRIIARAGSLDQRYLFHFLPDALAAIESVTSFATVKHLSVGTIREISIPLPPLPEQRRIAEILDRADELRVKRRRTISLLDELARSTFTDMVGSASGIDQRWPLGTVRDLLESAKYGSSSKAGAVGEFPILRMGNITHGGELDLRDMKYIDLSEAERDKYLVRRGDVLFNRTNSVDLVGKTAVVNVDVDSGLAFAGYLVRLRLKPEHRPEYLAAFLNSAYAKTVLRKMAKSIVGMANINAQEIQDVKIPIPTRNVQDLFAEKIAEVVAAKKTQLEHLAKLDALFASLQERAFAGEL
jgi:type I restriction enzyme, S subunit